MKKIIQAIITILRNFFINSFWKTRPVLAIIFLSVILNVVLWYIYEIKIRQNFIPFIFASGLIVLNLVLGNFVWEREKMASYFLIFVGLFTQILMLILIRYLTMVF